ncbi:uncharacterized protein LOC118202792 [Stegodyphus dumicola]|uniref:uncharacterized protein LOC118202792 n=1 Tax=Stegodyphus dumicola TaxID=202533 RepID=UPI0015A7C2D6|nr:uncharacterized protein LOC118202792 [Stegodyphus dumicola]
MEISDMIFWLTEGSAVEYLDLCCQEFQEKRNRTLIYALDLCVAPRRYSYSDKKRKELVRYWRESHGNEYFPSLNLTDYQSFPNRKLIEIFRIRREGVHLIDAGKYSFFLDFSKSILERLEMKWELKTAKHFLKHLKAYNDYTQKSLFPILDSWDPGNVTFEKPPIVYPSTFIQNYFMNLVKKETGQKLMKLLFENLCADSSLVVELFHTMCVRGFYKMHLLFKAEVMEYIFYHCKKEKYHITHFFHALREESLYKTLIRSSPKHLLVLLKYGFKFIFKGDWQFMYFLELYPTMNGRFYI